jgi:protoheme IX farnesyltransferase
VLTALASVLPLFQPQVGPVYLSCALALNVVLVVRAAKLYHNPERPQALGLYKYSMVYLALLFLVLAIDRSGPI